MKYDEDEVEVVSMCIDRTKIVDVLEMVRAACPLYWTNVRVSRHNFGWVFVTTEVDYWIDGYAAPDHMPTDFSESQQIYAKLGNRGTTVEIERRRN